MFIWLVVVLPSLQVPPHYCDTVVVVVVVVVEILHATNEAAQRITTSRLAECARRAASMCRASRAPRS